VPLRSLRCAGDGGVVPRRTRSLRAVAARRSRGVGDVVSDEHAAAATSRSEDRAGLVALCSMNTRPPAPVRPVAHDGVLALRPVDALLPRRCGPKTAQGWWRYVRWTRCRPSVVTRWITVDGNIVPVGHLGLDSVRPNGRAEPKTTSDSPRAGPTGRGPWESAGIRRPRWTR
jgi:hypothetical protein